MINETLASHIISVYNSMEADSIEQDDLRIYTGTVSTVMPKLGISMTYYKPIFRALYDGGYCALGDRGGRDKPSTVILIREPERDELLDLTTPYGSASMTIMTRLEAIESSLGGIDVLRAFGDVETRLVKLEESNGKS